MGSAGGEAGWLATKATVLLADARTAPECPLTLTGARVSDDSQGARSPGQLSPGPVTCLGMSDFTSSCNGDR